MLAKCLQVIRFLSSAYVGQRSRLCQHSVRVRLCHIFDNHVDALHFVTRAQIRRCCNLSNPAVMNLEIAICNPQPSQLPLRRSMHGKHVHASQAAAKRTALAPAAELTCFALSWRCLAISARAASHARGHIAEVARAGLCDLVRHRNECLLLPASGGQSPVHEHCIDRNSFAVMLHASAGSATLQVSVYSQ